mgnify:FL=1
MSTGLPVWLRRVPLTLLIGIPITMGLIVGLGVGLVTEQSEEASSVAVISTRPASSLPNERIDLINDLSTAITLPPVLDEVAASQDVSVTELRTGLSFERITSSSFARLTFASPDLDADERRAVIKVLLATTSDFLTPETPSPELVAAQRTEKEATDAYYAALSANDGRSPADELRRLNVRINTANAADDQALATRLSRNLPRLVNETRQFDLLKAARDRASETLQSLGASEAIEARGGPSALGISYVDESAPDAAGTEQGIASVAVRRGFAAGVAAALVLVGFTVMIAWGRRREDDLEARSPDDAYPSAWDDEGDEVPGGPSAPEETRPRRPVHPGG